MPTAAIIRKRKRLPHWETAGSTYFVTFRLADSLPAAALQRLRDERRAALEEVRSGPAANRPAAEKRFRRLFSRRVEEFLDKGSGACLLANPRLAQIVAGALCHFDGIRYELYAWCVMPNHVHVVFRPFSAYSSAGILHTWKSFTAHRAPAAVARGRARAARGGRGHPPGR